jgi:hypothetical protein
MTLPGINQTIRDGALGLLALGSEYHVKIGLSTLGTANVATAIADPQLVRDTFGAGPLVEGAVYAISKTNKPVICVKATQTTAGSVGSITQTGAGPLITATGSTPFDAYELRVKIILGGTVGVATFQYSLDGGDTWSATIATAASYVITAAGITIQFIAGTYIAAEVYSASCTPPAFDTTALNTALDAAVAAAQAWRLVHVIGFATAAAGSATVFAALASKMATAAAAYRYAYAVMEAADDTDGNLITAFASQADVRVMVCAGFEELVSAVDGRIYKRPSAWPVVARLMASAVSRDPGAYADGPLSGIVSLNRDEGKTPGLEDARFCVLRSFRGVPGFFVTRGRMMAPLGSDFSDSAARQVLDVASRVAYEALLQFVNIDLLVDATTGFILEQEAQSIEAFVLGQLRAAVTAPGDASDVQFTVKRNENILSSQTLRAKTRVIPKGYARFIENEIAFKNPALEPPGTP